MNERKLQVFVSSTFTDLQKERQAAVEAILQAGHIPAGMELFTAGDDAQLDVIKEWIEESDLLLLILGQRYGSIEPKEGKSYTQLEYEYAIHKGKPVFAIVLSDDWLSEKFVELKGDASDDHRKEHAAFKGIVLSRMSRFVRDTKDIAIEVGRSLNKFAKDDRLIGWVRADRAATNEAVVAELTKTIEDLRTRRGSEAPSAADIDKELELRIDELRHMAIHFETDYKFKGAENIPRHSLDTTGLALVCAHANSLNRGDYRVDLVQPWDAVFAKHVVPLLEIWGLIEVNRTYVNRTMKGRLLLNKLGDTKPEDVGGARFLPLLAEPQADPGL